MSRHSTLWHAAFSVFLVLTGAVVLLQMQKMPPSQGYDSVGASFFPSIAAVGLILVGALNLWKIARAGAPPVDVLDALPFILISVGLILQVVLIQRAGWIISSTLQFMLTARAFGNFGYLRSIAFGLILSGATYLGFAYGLGLDLPLLPLLNAR